MIGFLNGWLALPTAKSEPLALRREPLRGTRLHFGHLRRCVIRHLRAGEDMDIGVLLVGCL